jgi:hypothetical protein
VDERLGASHEGYLVSESSVVLKRCPLNINIVDPKVTALHMGPVRQNYDFLGNYVYNLVKFCQFSDTISLI